MTNERTTVKVRISEVRPGMTVRFGTTTKWSFVDQADLPVLERECLPMGSVRTIASVEVESCRTYSQTGRRGRQYVVTFTDGRAVKMTPQSKVEVLS